MKRVEPSLIEGRWLPCCNDVVAILVEAEVQAERVVRGAANAVVALHSYPWVYYFLYVHIA